MSGAVFSAAEWSTATGGTWMLPPSPSQTFGVYTDTRQPGEGRLFLALAGESFDAHDLLDKAVSGGAGALCIARSKTAKLPPDCPLPVLLTDDPLGAYQAIANFHRCRFPHLKLAAVTGSVGKTSVKEMLRAIFTEAAGVHLRRSFFVYCIIISDGVSCFWIAFSTSISAFTVWISAASFSSHSSLFLP